MSTEIVQVRQVAGSSSLILQTSSLPIPSPRTAISIREATPADAGFIDALQKKHSKAVGWFPRGQIEGYIRLGGILIAEDARDQRSEIRDQEDKKSEGRDQPERSGLTSDLRPLTSIGYVIFRDRYMKRDEVGAIYQMNVEPGRHRKLVGAALLRAVFEKSAYGCRLYGCWCAQDLPANYFWEAMGFVPIAFRAGSRGKRRMHIYWQRRIRQGDVTTPYWFPSETKSGAIREDRLVLPIPPGVSWKDVMPEIWPEVRDQKSEVREERGQTSEVRDQKDARDGARLTSDLRPLTSTKVAVVIGGKVRMVEKKSATAEQAAPEKPKKVKKKREPAKNDPRMIAAARILRDRWMEEAISGRLVLEGNGKYEVGRLIEGAIGVGIGEELAVTKTIASLPMSAVPAA